MNTRATLVLAVVAALVFGGAVFLFKNKQTTREEQAAAGRILEIDRDQINKMVIVNPDGEIVFSKEGDYWMLEKPVKGKASLSAISQLMTSLELLKSEDIIDGTAEEREKQFELFGLNQPTLRIKMIGPNEEKELVFGKPTAIEGRTYAAVAGEKKAYVVRNELPDMLKAKAEDFRDRRLTNLSAELVSKLVLKTPAGEIELKKNGEHWAIVKPLNARASDSKVNDLIAKITNAQITKFASEQSADHAQFGLTEPQGTVELYESEEGKPLAITFGKAPEDDKEAVYVKLSSGDSTFAITRTAQEALLARPNDLRDRNLAQINLDTVDRIRVESAGSSFLLSRKEDGWELRNGHQFAVPKHLVGELVTTLNGAHVTSFVADTPADASKYGLDKPTLRITFSSFASENTPESPAGEQKIATISFGKAEDKELYARVEEDPFILGVNPRILRGILTDPLEWQDRQILALNPDDVVSIKVERPGKDTVEVARNGEGKWELKSTTGELNANAVESLLASVKKLLAVRWAGAVVAEYGLEIPEVTVTFGLKTGEPKSYTIKVGAQTPEQMRYASISGKDGAFVVSRPQYENLTLPLLMLKPTTGAESPSPTGTP